MASPERALAASAPEQAIVERARRTRFWVALAIALVADIVQIALFPLFGEGAASPYDDGLDIVVAIALVWLLGFHWALVPALVAELVPAVDLVPTWTASVLIVAWSRKRTVARQAIHRAASRRLRSEAHCRG